jgi:hypothetical protein
MKQMTPMRRGWVVRRAYRHACLPSHALKQASLADLGVKKAL